MEFHPRNKRFENYTPFEEKKETQKSDEWLLFEKQKLRAGATLICLLKGRHVVVEWNRGLVGSMYNTGDPYIYTYLHCHSGIWMLPTTFWHNQKSLLTWRCVETPIPLFKEIHHKVLTAVALFRQREKPQLASLYIIHPSSAGWFAQMENCNWMQVDHLKENNASFSSEEWSPAGFSRTRILWRPTHVGGASRWTGGMHSPAPGPCQAYHPSDRSHTYSTKMLWKMIIKSKCRILRPNPHGFAFRTNACALSSFGLASLFQEPVTKLVCGHRARARPVKVQPRRTLSCREELPLWLEPCSYTMLY